MGRIDADKMYDIVMKWDWGNSGSDEIYHDTETRRNGITYRSNLARLAEKLIEEGKIDKAEKVMDLAMEKMPVKYFEYYTLLEPFIQNYYEIEKTEKARKVYEETSKIYAEYAAFYGRMSLSEQLDNLEEIYSKLNQYESLVEVVYVYDTKEYYQKEKEKFKNFLQPFRGMFARLGMDIDEEFLQKEKRAHALDSLLNLTDSLSD